MAADVSPRSAYLEVRSLVRSGLTETEAGNVVAWEMGLMPMAHGWQARQLAQLRFLAWLRATGRWSGPEDRFRRRHRR